MIEEQKYPNIIRHNFVSRHILTPLEMCVHFERLLSFEVLLNCFQPEKKVHDLELFVKFFIEKNIRRIFVVKHFSSQQIPVLDPKSVVVFTIMKIIYTPLLTNLIYHS